MVVMRTPALPGTDRVMAWIASAAAGVICSKGAPPCCSPTRPSLRVNALKTIAYLLLGFVVPLQLIACVFAFLARDSVAVTGLGLFAGAWLASGLTLLNAQPGTTSHAFGVFLLSIGACMVVLVSGAAF